MSQTRNEGLDVFKEMMPGIVPDNMESLRDGSFADEMFELSLAENDRRLQRYDARLLRPRLVPFAARLAMRFMKRGR